MHGQSVSSGAATGGSVADRVPAADPAERLPSRLAFLSPSDGLSNVLHVLATHALLLLWFWLAWRTLPLWAYGLLTALACLVHQRAMSEWIHEGAHHNLVRDRRLGDILTNLLAGVWFGVTVDAYRSVHFTHHARRGFFVGDDPDTAFLVVDSRRGFRRAVLADLTGLTTLRQYRRFAAGATGGTAARGGWLFAMAAVHLGALGSAVTLGRVDVYLVYYASLGLLYPLLNRLRVYGQHATLDADGRSLFAGSSTSRTIDAGLADRILFTSPRLLYHHEHHLWPHLPYRALRHLCVPCADVNRYARGRWPVLRAVYRGLPP
jgi:fatty acid desaturase